MLKTGFSRTDITPPMGINLAGYPSIRLADGVLDPLLATAVAFDNGEKKAVVISLDLLGLNSIFMNKVRPMVAETIGTDVDAVFIACTHTHLGPDVAPVEQTTSEFNNPEYAKWLMKRICDVAFLAMQDLAPSKLSYTRGTAKDVSFIRRFRMKDGTTRTNPGYQNPDIAHALCNPDEVASLLIIKREGKPEIGIVNFQVHPDVIGGTKISADYPKFVRDTYELLIPNSLCMYLNGAQGDSNHADVRLNPETDCVRGYARSRYMGRKIAMSVVGNYELAKEIKGEKIRYNKKTITVKFNKGTPEEIPDAMELSEQYSKMGYEGVLPGIDDRFKVTMLASANRIAQMQAMPDDKDLTVTALSVGDMVFAGFPGEPFTDIGREIKNNSKFSLTVPVCAANGYEGYYPMQSAFDEGGYEAVKSRYVGGTAEKLIEASTEIINSMK